MSPLQSCISFVLYITSFSILVLQSTSMNIPAMNPGPISNPITNIVTSCLSLDQYKKDLSSYQSELSSVQTNYNTWNNNHLASWNILKTLTSAKKYNAWYKWLLANKISVSVVDCFVAPCPNLGKGLVLNTETPAYKTWQNVLHEATTYDSKTIAKIMEGYHSSVLQFQKQITYLTTMVKTLQGDIQSNECHTILSAISTLINDVKKVAVAIGTFLENNACIILEWGLYAAAAIIDQAVIPAIPDLGEIIIAMQQEPECTGMVVGKSLTTPSSSMSYTYVLTAVSDVICLLSKQPMLQSQEMTNLCYSAQTNADVASAVMAGICGQFATAIIDILEPVIMCSINIAGKNCGAVLQAPCNAF
eukprot:Awhi_evm1s5567